MNDICYIFGAGASRNALPIVREMPDRISEVANLLEKSNFDFPVDDKFSKELGVESISEIHEVFLADLNWLKHQCSKHASIDTFAKKLSIRSKHYRDKYANDLNKLKAILSCFFIIEQTRKPIDFRYDQFWASIIEDDISNLPSNIKILSWNYDFQFEKSVYDNFPNDQILSIKDIDQFFIPFEL